MGIVSCASNQQTGPMLKTFYNVHSHDRDQIYTNEQYLADSVATTRIQYSHLLAVCYTLKMEYRVLRNVLRPDAEHHNPTTPSLLLYYIGTVCTVSI